MKHVLAFLAAISLTACIGGDEYSQPIELPRTKDADAFAKAFLDQLQARSFATNKEHCGLFGRDAQDYVVATAPLVGQTYGCPPPNVPAGFRVFASYHSHGGFDFNADSEVPSSYDVIADREEGVIGYISTPGGRLWASQDGVATLVCGIGCIAKDPAFESLVYGPVRSRYTIEDLRLREQSL